LSDTVGYVQSLVNEYWSSKHCPMFLQLLQSFRRDRSGERWPAEGMAAMMQMWCVRHKAFLVCTSPGQRMDSPWTWATPGCHKYSFIQYWFLRPVVFGLVWFVVLSENGKRPKIFSSS